MNTLKRFRILAGAALVASPLGLAAPPTAEPADRLARIVRRELATLPFHCVFDNMALRIAGDKATLSGNVTGPTLKADVGAVLKPIEGIGEVVNQIEALPLSPSDDRLSLALYRAIHGHPELERFALRAAPPIRIFVENGKAALEGAEAEARGLPGLFSVPNAS